MRAESWMRIGIAMPILESNCVQPLHRQRGDRRSGVTRLPTVVSKKGHAMYTPTPALPDEFSGRRALVTGGSRGIGAAIAQRLIDGRATVVTSARAITDDTPKESTFLS